MRWRVQNFQDTIFSVKGTTMQTRTSNIILARRSSRRCLAVTSSQTTNLEPEISLVVSENHLVEEAASPLTRSWLPICMCFYKALFSFFLVCELSQLAQRRWNIDHMSRCSSKIVRLLWTEKVKGNPPVYKLITVLTRELTLAADRKSVKGEDRFTW